MVYRPSVSILFVIAGRREWDEECIIIGKASTMSAGLGFRFHSSWHSLFLGRSFVDAGSRAALHHDADIRLSIKFTRRTARPLVSSQWVEIIVLIFSPLLVLSTACLSLLLSPHRWGGSFLISWCPHHFFSSVSVVLAHDLITFRLSITALSRVLHCQLHNCWQVGYNDIIVIIILRSFRPPHTYAPRHPCFCNLIMDNIYHNQT